MLQSNWISKRQSYYQLNLSGWCVYIFSFGCRAYTSGNLLTNPQFLQDWCNKESRWQGEYQEIRKYNPLERTEFFSTSVVSDPVTRPMSTVYFCGYQSQCHTEVCYTTLIIVIFGAMLYHTNHKKIGASKPFLVCFWVTRGNESEINKTPASRAGHNSRLRPISVLKTQVSFPFCFNFCFTKFK